MNAPTDWVSASAILAAGLVLGFLLYFAFSRKRTTAKLAGAPDLEYRDLEAKRDALILRLREIDSDPKLTPDQVADERMRLEKETADVLRRLDDSRAARSESGTEPVPSTREMNPAFKGFLWGALSVTALFGLGYFVMKSASPREEGGSPTGGMTSPQQQPAPQEDPRIAGLLAQVAREPENLQLRNDLAQAYLESDNLMAVFEQTKFVLAKTPEDPRALTLQGLVRMAMGETELATNMLLKSTKIDPKNLDAWVALAWAYSQQNRMQDAEAMIAEAAKQSPQDKAKLEEIFRQMKEHALQETAPAQTARNGELPPGHPSVGGQLPPGHPPAEGSSPSPAAASAAPVGAQAVRITIDLDPAARSRSGILFVMAKSPQGGPPVAVKRLEATQFPMTIELSSADSMMGQALPASFRVEARLDSDGNAMTKVPTDPSAAQDNVAPGATVRLALR